MTGIALPYPFDLGFMQRALVAGLVVGAFAPLIGTFLVQKRMSLIGDGIGHVAFAGVGAGLLLSVWPLSMALLFAVVGALGVDYLRSRRRASGDVALALLFYSGIALGVVLIGLGGGLNANILTYLFGAPLTVKRTEVIVIVVLGIGIASVVWTLRRAMFASVTDEDWSRIAGLPVGAMNSVLAVLTACAVVAAMRVVGILLVAAMMVLPVASAQLLARSFRATLLWGSAIGICSVVVGLIVSWIWNLAPSGTIVLVAAAWFGIVSAIRRQAPRTLRQEEHP